MHTVHEWKTPANYFGAEWHGWHSAGFGQSRDSDALESSNFQTAYDALKPSRFPIGQCKKCGKKLEDDIATMADGQTIVFCSYECYASD